MENEKPKIRKTLYTVCIKRILDILASGLAILVLSPLFLVISVLELVYHGRPILYSQVRIGKDEKEFKLYKFRSMTNEVDENGKLLPARQRLTKFGRIIRKLSLDELPELFSIFTGKMSVIGPRPLMPSCLPYYTERHRYRHAVRPGLAVTSLKPLNSWTWNDQFENDIWYVENCSFLVDIREVFSVLKEAIRGSEYRVNATRKNLDADYWKNA